MKRTLWIETTKEQVIFRNGHEMPKELTPAFHSLLYHPVPREEFERWSGVSLPKGSGHVLGLEVKFAVIARKRVVTEKAMVTTEHTRSHVVDA